MTKSLVVNCRRNSLSFCVTRKRFGERFISFMVKRKEQKKKKTIHPVKSTDESKTFNNIVYVSRINNRRFIGTAHKLFVGLTLRVIGYWRLSVDCFYIPRWAIFKRRCTYGGTPPKHSVFSVCTRVSRRIRIFLLLFSFYPQDAADVVGHRFAVSARHRPQSKTTSAHVRRTRARLVLNKTRTERACFARNAGRRGNRARHWPRREANGVAVVCTNLESREHPP